MVCSGRSMVRGRRSVVCGAVITIACSVVAVCRGVVGCQVAFAVVSSASISVPPTPVGVTSASVEASMGSSFPSGAAVSAGAIASGNATTAVLKDAAIATAEVTVVDDRHAIRNVGIAAEEHGPTVPGRSPGAETPVDASVNADRNGRIEGKPDGRDDAGWRRQHDEPGVRDKQRPPNAPRVVVGHVNDGRINRHDGDHALFNDDALLGRGHQRVRLLRLQAHRLDRVHHVARLVVVGVA